MPVVKDGFCKYHLQFEEKHPLFRIRTSHYENA